MSAELEAVASTLERLALAHHPVARPRDAGGLARALSDGIPAPEALASLGAAPSLLEFVRLAAPSDLPGVLDAVAHAVGRGEDRARARRDAAFYPLILSVSTTVLAVALVTGLLPAMRTLSREIDSPRSSWAATVAVVSLAAAGGILAVMAFSLSRGARVFPFAGAAAREESARVLSGAAAAAARGVPLPKALAAGAVLAPEGPARESARAVAASLERGEAEAVAGRGLFGEIGAALFAAACAKGGGETALAALSDAAERDAEASVPFETMRAEIISLAVAGAALGAAATAWAILYSGAFR